VNQESTQAKPKPPAADTVQISNAAKAALQEATETAAQTAKEAGFDYFSTTLLVSPYQDQESLKEIGNNISKEEGVAFYYEDFRPGFRKAHNLAKERGIYCQKYCGCTYSELERYSK